MKGIVILIVVLVLGALIYVAGRKQEVEAAKQKEPSQAGRVVQEVQDTASYATGAAQIQAGKKAKNKIQQIQDMKNEQNAKTESELEK